MIETEAPGSLEFR